MLWLIVILLIGSLSIVLFHKPHVNPMGAGWMPPEQRTPVAPPPARKAAAPGVSSEATSASVDGSGLADWDAEDAVTTPVPKVAAAMPDTFDFNDLFGGRNTPPTDRPHA